MLHVSTNVRRFLTCRRIFNHSKVCTLLVAMSVILVLTKILPRETFLKNDEDFKLLPDLLFVRNKTNMLPFEPDDIDDFPTTSGEPRIPHIIHQVYKDDYIPTELAQYVKSFIDNNPSWKYYFWTDKSGRQLIKERHVELLTVWDNLKSGIFKGDIIRIVALYEFGGGYFDLDVENHRSLDRVTRKYSCIIPTEPFEQNILLYNREIFLNNAIIFCRAKHPFLKMLLGEFRTIDASYVEHVVNITGPEFITRMYQKYNNHTSNTIIDNNKYFNINKTISSSPYFFKSILPENHSDTVYIPNSKYFTDKLDTDLQLERFVTICKQADTQSFSVRRACAQIDRRGFFRRSNKFAFTTHKYAHLWITANEPNSMITYLFGRRAPTTNIIDVVPARLSFI